MLASIWSSLCNLCAALMLALSPLLVEDNSRLGMGGLMIGFVCLTAVQVFGNRDFAWFRNLQPLDYAVALFLFAATVSVCGSPFPAEAISGWAKYALYGLVYWSFCRLIAPEEKLNRSVVVMLIGATLLCGLLPAALEGISQVINGAEALATWTDPDTASNLTMSRIYSTLLNPNLFACYLLLAAPLMLVFVFDYGLPYKMLSVCGMVVCMWLLIQTGSRAGWIGLGVAVVFAIVVTLWRFRSVWLFVFAAICGVSGFTYFLSKPALLNRLLTIFDAHADSSNSYRMHVWDACLKLASASPLSGVGPGSQCFYLGYGIYAHSGYGALGAYNVPLEIAVEMGWFGVFALIVLLLITVYGVFNELNHPLKPEHWTLALALGTALVGMLMAAQFDIVILRPQLMTLVCLQLALLRSLNLSPQVNVQTSAQSTTP